MAKRTTLGQMNVGTRGACVLFVAAVLAIAQDQPGKPLEQERQVKETEVPKAALDALKKLAGAAALTEFAEEIEHQHKFYEGSWKGATGNVDALVTEAGDLVELEEVVPADKVPAAARAEVEKVAGKDATLTWEKKTYIMYEVHFKKDGKGHEVLLTPDGRRHEEEQEQGDKDDATEDEK